MHVSESQTKDATYYIHVIKYQDTGKETVEDGVDMARLPYVCRCSNIDDLSI